MLSLLKLKIGANNAQMGFGFVAMLGQSGLNIKEFCNLFNKQTEAIFHNVPLNVKVKISKKGKYLITYKIPTYFFITFYKSEINSDVISLENFYKIMHIYYLVNRKDTFFLSLSFARILAGTLKSMKMHVREI